MIIIGCSASRKLAKSIARKLKKPYYELRVGSFPDGETHIKFPTDIKGRVIVLVQTLNNPNQKLIELLFAAYTAKDLGARRVVLVAPYLAYMRQDKRFHAGECISNKVIAELFRVFDGIVTVDPHLHRVKSLRQLFRIRAKALSASPLLARYIYDRISTPVVIGPDEESYQWAERVAKMAGCPVTVLKKKRYSATKVKIVLRDPHIVRGRNVVVVDDIISTGHTMIETIRQAKKAGAKSVCCMAVHGVFADDALKRLRRSGARVITANTIENPAARIDTSTVIAGAL